MREEDVISPPAPVTGFGVRHGQILLHFLFYIIVYGIEFALSSTLPAIMITKRFEDVHFQTISNMVIAYLIGFLITELFSGVVCKKYGFKWPMIIFMSIVSAVTLNFPTLTKEYGPTGVIVARVIQGLCLGLLFAMPSDAINRWAPIRERTTLGTTVYASGILGGVLSSYVGGYLSESVNWSFLYTQLGLLAIIWVVLMAIFGADSPEEYPRKITESELAYIVDNRGNVIVKKKMKIPWSKILSSLPFWAIVVAQIGAGWIPVVLAINLPQFLRQSYNVRLTPNMQSLGGLLAWILTFVMSSIAQMLINHERTTTGQSRKLFNTIGTCIPAFLLIVLTILPSGNQYVGIAIWITMYVTSVATILGSRLNANDITTNFAPIVSGTSIWIGAVFNLVSMPVLGSYMFDSWNVIFIYSAILAVLTNLFYLKFGSGEEQDWNLYDYPEEEEPDLSKSASRASVDEGKYLLYVKKQYGSN